jgi:hypothetical protein
MPSEHLCKQLAYISWLDSCFNTAEVVGSIPAASIFFICQKKTLVAPTNLSYMLEFSGVIKLVMKKN